ncbi:cytosine deaminase [Streptococcus pyogenes]|uniref:Cytosine deaminase n=1 Tax=Streptococcus pyogenes TaxID=1314 RepID=A0A5S4TJJ5_STRPY|nr:cytosine deaminase [Streptococcus pyogenes]AXI57565.1 cytosine deaminase [Streptococcus pyogenes]AYJ02972.1 cytosine deaminase [Streptococcus pyogenes]AYO92218.1 cytosine deaminase [Streptococcus pyogenes]AYZ09196.1 cytosine deaminase [Streptococcus pyogenes]
MAHFVCKNRKPDVKSAELFMLFEHKTGVVYVLTLVSIIQEFLFIFR